MVLCIEELVQQKLGNLFIMVFDRHDVEEMLVASFADDSGYMINLSKFVVYYNNYIS